MENTNVTNAVIEVAGMALKKRSRTENWLDQDKLLLKELVRERVRAIENKNTDSNTNKKKKDAWADLHNTFNSLCTGVQRSVAQLKTQWSVMKVNAKKEKALYRRESMRTGGGPCPPEPDNQSADDISSWLPHEFSVDLNKFDCDKSIAVEVLDDDDVLSYENPKEPVKPPEAGKIIVHNIEVIPTQPEMVPAPLEMVTAPLEVVPPSLEVEDPLEVVSRNITTSANSIQISQKNLKVKKQKLKKKIKRLPEVGEALGAASKIMEVEIQCRHQLHELQMENERKRGQNLDLKKELILAKLNYFNRK